MIQVDSNESNNLKFENAKSFFMSGLNSNDLNINLASEKFNSNDEIIKTAIEHSFRIYIIQNLKNMEIEDMKKVIDLSIQASQKKLCLPTTPIFLINDMLSSLTIDKCSEIFCYLEDSAHIWKSEIFYSSVKNYLLRMCNDLLKRLSKSQNTVFSGRIHLFLAKLFPLNEKSGLNLMSHFSDNFTRYTSNPKAFEEAINKNKIEQMETDDTNDKISSHMMPIDFNLYTKFWSLQEVFNKPNTCYDKTAWRTFTNNATEVLEALKSYKLEDVKEEIPSKAEEYDDLNSYFSKYLTSEKLLDLQLNDSNFRRQILLQFLILFQYLTADVKFKTTTQVLSEEQNSWIKSSIKKVNELLKETPPQGSKFNNNIKHILEREEIWNKWKNESCPNYVKEKKSAQQQTKTPTKRPKPVSSDFLSKSSPPNKIFLTDTSVISKLCNVNHGNLEECKDPNRQFLPSLKEFFEEAIDQLDPANQVEKQYYLINQTDWAWKALRLLAKRSPYYFMQNQNVKTISEYLEAICNKLAKEFETEQDKLKKQQEKDENKTKSELLNHIKQVSSLNPTESDSRSSGQNINENDNSQQGNDDEAVQLNDDQTHSVSIKNEINDESPQQDEDEQMDESSNNPINDQEVNEEKPFKEETKLMDTSLEEKLDEEMKQTVNEEQISSNRFIDSDLIDYVVSNIDDEGQLKNLSDNLVKLISDEVHIDDDDNLKSKCKKVLQIWTEHDERKDLVSVLLDELRSVGNEELASKVELKFK